ncbi:MAG: N-6 DNA methylase [Labilithrix sp.]
MPKRHRPGASAASILRHIEEIVLATSGEDAFETVYAVAAKRLGAQALQVARVRDRKLFARVDALLADALHDESTLDAIFESLVPRVAKGDKGQFFTPRSVVDFVIDMLAPRKRELVVDPACGSGAFLSRARAAGAKARGADVDGRAVRVARLLAAAAGAGIDTVEREDSLRARPAYTADVVATNPPFAGRVDGSGFSVAEVVRTPERDVLFLERALELLRPGGRLGIVLPYNKASASAFAGMRRWLVERARVLAVVGLPRETFLPHTSQRTFVLFARKRAAGRAASPAERTFFAISERAGKDTGGEPIFTATGALDHDLADVARSLGPFLRAEGFGA